VVFHVRYLSVILGLFLSASMAHLAGFDLSILDKLLPSDNEFSEETSFKKIKVAPKKNHRNKSGNTEASYTFFEVLTGEDNDNFVDMEGVIAASPERAKPTQGKRDSTPRQITKPIKGEKINIAIKKVEKSVEKTSASKTSISTTPKASAPKTSTTKVLTPQPSTVRTPPKNKIPASNGKYVVQAGSFKSMDSANRLVAKLKSKGYSAYWKETKVDSRKWFRVYLGSFSNHDDALALVQKARAEEKLDPMIAFLKD
jgi:septal ring-binding cell division protein DamX